MSAMGCFDSARSWIGRRHTRVTSTDAHDDLTNVYTGNSAVGLTPGTTHTGLQSIGTSARQHLVDTDDVEGVSADTQVETFLSGVLDEVLVGANTGGLEGLGTQLLILVGDKVDAEREVVNVRTLAAQVEDSDLGVGYTAVEPGLRVGLSEEESQRICSIENVGVACRVPFFGQILLKTCKRSIVKADP